MSDEGEASALFQPRAGPAALRRSLPALTPSDLERAKPWQDKRERVSPLQSNRLLLGGHF